MELIAHRGFADVYPENTVAAVEAAAARADAIEVDVRRCGSGELVVVHDGTVDRVTDATGPVAAYDADELAAMDVLGSGEGIPTLEAVLAAVPGGVGVNVELKERAVATDVLAAADRAGIVPLVSSFLDDALVACREAAPDVPVAYLFHEDPDGAVGRARELGCAYVHPHLDLAESIVDRAHEAGMGVNVWTLDRREQAEAMDALGVDGVIADDPDAWEPERNRSD